MEIVIRDVKRLKDMRERDSQERVYRWNSLTLKEGESKIVKEWEMNRWFVFAILLIILLPGCSTSEMDDGMKKAREEDRRRGFLQVGDMSPDFSLELLEGRKFSLSNQKGRVVLINFWASWCKPCREEAPALQQAYLRYQDKGVEFIGIAVQDREKKIRGFIKEFGITFLIGFDRKLEVADSYKVYGIPKTFILNREGRISFISIGAVSERILTREIEKVLG